MDSTQILDGVAATFGVTADRLRGPRRDGRLCAARNVAYYLLRELTDHSTTEIGRILNRDHSTVISGSQAIEARMEAQPGYALTIQRLRRGLWDERGAMA